MVDRRSKYSISARDRTSSIGGDTVRNFNDNFTTEFLKFSDEYNVRPLPKIISYVDLRVPGTLSSVSESIEDDGSPVFHFTYQNKKLASPAKIESKGREVSICILDALNSTMQRFSGVTVLRLPDCNINAFGVMQIAEMLTNIGCLRDLNLDMNPNVQENYHLLCASRGSLRYLSLRLCKITDAGVEKIARELRYRDPPNDPKLLILNLAHNHVTKDGAVHLGQMLRTNRSLRCLVLLGNRICDEGASSILQQLKIITLSHEEIVELRRRKFAELALLDQWSEKRKSEDAGRSLNDESLKKNAKFQSRTRQSPVKRTRKHSGVSTTRTGEDGDAVREAESARKIEAIPEDDVCHPFRKESCPMNGEIMATGNLDLQYLDLSYNHLTKSILRELIDCLYYQNYMLLGDRRRGLLHLLVEGRGFREEGGKDWDKFVVLLQQRQSGNPLTRDTFREHVPDESEILRDSVHSPIA